IKGRVIACLAECEEKVFYIICIYFPSNEQKRADFIDEVSQKVSTFTEINDNVVKSIEKSCEKYIWYPRVGRVPVNHNTLQLSIEQGGIQLTSIKLKQMALIYMIKGTELFWQYLEEAESKSMNELKNSTIPFIYKMIQMIAKKAKFEESHCPEQWDKALELPITIFNTQMTLELPRQRSKTPMAGQDEIADQILKVKNVAIAERLGDKVAWDTARLEMWHDWADKTLFEANGQ
uniref:Uncharacterized protein n=1 Tax=Romanomermis culicivorax TaxID=13658 RepID=A0A915K7V2_ROMCU